MISIDTNQSKEDIAFDLNILFQKLQHKGVKAYDFDNTEFHLSGFKYIPEENNIYFSLKEENEEE